MSVSNFEGIALFKCILLFEIQVLIDQGQCLLKECNQLMEHCGQNHGQQSQSTINNKKESLRQGVNQYRMQIDHFKHTMRNFGSTLQECITTARKKVRHGNNTAISYGVDVAGCVLTLLVSCSVGGSLGSVLAVGSIVYCGMSVKEGVEAHSAVQGVVKIKEDYEKTLKNTEEWYGQLCKQHVAVEDSFARCEQLVEEN